MAKAVKVKQVAIAMKDKLGLMAEVSGALADAKVNIQAVCAYGMENKAHVIMLTDSNAKAKRALSKLGGEVSEDDVVLVEMADKPGELQKVTDKVAAAGINVWYVYGSAGSKTRSLLVMATEDNAKAVRVINK